MTSEFYTSECQRKVILIVSRQQAERDWVLAEFKSGRSPIMLATDVASRGLGMFPQPLHTPSLHPYFSRPARLVVSACRSDSAFTEAARKKWRRNAFPFTVDRGLMALNLMTGSA